MEILRKHCSFTKNTAICMRKMEGVTGKLANWCNAVDDEDNAGEVKPRGKISHLTASVVRKKYPNTAAFFSETFFLFLFKEKKRSFHLKQENKIKTNL